MNEKEKLVAFFQENRTDLEALGLLFLRLLRTDYNVLDAKPSPVLFAIMVLSQSGKLGTTKKIEELINELGTTGEEFLTDGFNGSILRL